MSLASYQMVLTNELEFVIQLDINILHICTKFNFLVKPFVDGKKLKVLTLTSSVKLNCLIVFRIIKK